MKTNGREVTVHRYNKSLRFYVVELSHYSSHSYWVVGWSDNYNINAIQTHERRYFGSGVKKHRDLIDAAIKEYDRGVEVKSTPDREPLDVIDLGDYYIGANGEFMKKDG